MNKIAKTIILALISSLCFGQTFLKIEKINELSYEIFEAIKPFPIIWIGEMHGANEPAEFAESIVNLLIKNNQKVTFGFEIKESDVPIQRDSISFVSSINAETYESRATLAWLNLILRMERNDQVQTIYFDENSEAISNNERDSLMAVNIIKKWDQKTTLVLLSGNLHNLQEARNGSKKAALHLLEMTNGAFEMLSLTHSFKKGQILTGLFDDEGNPTFTDFDFSASPRLNQPQYQQNHIYISDTLKNGWNGHFYTEFVTPAGIVNSN